MNVIPGTFEELEFIKNETGQKLVWTAPFMLPSWLKVWWSYFGERKGKFIRIVKEGTEVIGVAPMMREGNVVSFIGSIDVCDYEDFIVFPGKEKQFFTAFLNDMRINDVTDVDLKHVRPDSLVMNALKETASEKGLIFTSEKEEVSFEMILPDTFDAYIESLNTKQRHEVRRKLRRLNEEGATEYHFISQGPELKEALETFFRMFVESREDKAAFLTDSMKQYFRAIVAAVADEGILRLGVLELDKRPVAEILCFEYNNCLYLYNSGYDPKYVGLSAGVLSKILAIKYCIEKGIKKFDFLKGAEPYKAHIGGQEVSLFHCRIKVK